MVYKYNLLNNKYALFTNLVHLLLHLLLIAKALHFLFQELAFEFLEDKVIHQSLPKTEEALNVVPC